MIKILISNDDGVYAQGIRVLSDSLKTLAKTHIIAPDRNRSGASNSLTLDRPVRIKQLDESTLSVEGTPTDCVHLALTGVLDYKPDMVVSGINEGANLGDDILYSGTVAAATEGRRLGIPAIAFSMAERFSQPTLHYHYETAGAVAAHLVQQLIKNPLPAQTILNVNVPNVPFDALNGYEITRLGTRHIAERTVSQIDPRGHTVYWVGPAGPEQDAGPGTDFYAVNSGRVSITPLQIDLTHYAVFEDLSKWIKYL